MNKFLAFCLLVISGFYSFSVNKIDLYLLSKYEYKDLESKNKLVERAISNAFGVSNESNDYMFNIKKVDVWNDDVKEFRYFPDVDVESKGKLQKIILESQKNYVVKFKVTINPEKSFLTAKIRDYIDENNSFTLEIGVVSDERIFVTEAVDKDVYNDIIANKSFVDKAFKNFFGVNVMNMNYLQLL